MKRCPNCGEYIDDSDRFCSKCGKEVVEVVDTIVVSEDYNGDDYTKEQMLLRDQYSRRASNALTLSIVSIVLCCCSITAIISLIFSITLIFDMKKLSPEIKSTIEYNKIKNKNIVALVLAGFVMVMWLVSFIEGLINPINYEDLYNSIYDEMLNA